MLLQPVSPLLLHVFAGSSLWIGANPGAAPEVSTFPVQVLDDLPIDRAVADYLAEELKDPANANVQTRAAAVVPAVLARDASEMSGGEHDSVVPTQADVRCSQQEPQAEGLAGIDGDEVHRRQSLALQVRRQLAAQHYTEAKLCAQYVLSGFSPALASPGEEPDDPHALVRAIVHRRTRAERQQALERDVTARLGELIGAGAGGGDVTRAISRLRSHREYQLFLLHGLPAPVDVGSGSRPDTSTTGLGNLGLSSSGDAATDVRRMARYLVSRPATEVGQSQGPALGSSTDKGRAITGDTGSSEATVATNSRAVLVQMVARAQLPAHCPNGLRRLDLASEDSARTEASSMGSLELMLEAKMPGQCMNVVISSACLAVGGAVDQTVLPNGSRLAETPSFGGLVIVARPVRVDKSLPATEAPRTTTFVVPQPGSDGERAAVTAVFGETLTFSACDVGAPIEFELWRAIKPLGRQAPRRVSNAGPPTSAASPKRHPLRPQRQPRARRQLSVHPAPAARNSEWRERDLSTHPDDSVALRAVGIPAELRPLLSASQSAHGMEALAFARIDALLRADTTLATAQFGSSHWMTALHAAAVSAAAPPRRPHCLDAIHPLTRATFFAPCA